MTRIDPPLDGDVARLLRQVYTAVTGTGDPDLALQAAAEALSGRLDGGLAVVGLRDGGHEVLASTLDLPDDADPTADPRVRTIEVAGTRVSALLVAADVDPALADLLAALGLIIDEELGHLHVERDLEERVKELTALREVQLAVESAGSRTELYHRVCEALVAGMQFPELARAELHVDGIAESGGAVGPIVNSVTTDIVADSTVRGELVVGYVEHRAFLDPEEPNLVDAVARSVGQHLELADANAASRASADRLRRVLDSLPSAVLTVDQSLLVEVVTQAPGFPIEPVVGAAGRLDEWDDPGREPLIALVRTGLAGRATRDEVHWRDRWWDVRVEPQFAEDGQIPRVLIMVLDVTDQVRRRHAEQSLAAIVESSPVAIVGIDLDGRITGWNRGATELFGWSDDEVLGESLTLLDVEGYGGYTVSSGIDRLREGRFEEGYIEALRRHRDGHGVHVGVTMAHVREEGELAGVLAIYRDLTEREVAREALAVSEEQFQLIAENIQDVVYRMSLEPEPSLDYVSPSVEGVLGFPAEMFEGDLEMLTTRIHPDDRDVVLRIMEDPSGSAGIFRWRWRHVDGEWVWLEDHRNLIAHGGRPVALVGVIRDVTDEQRDIDQTREALEHERRVADELRRIDTMKTTFLSAVSHEVRTPLTSILGFAETAQRMAEHTNPVMEPMLNRLMDNAKRLERLVDDLLDVDRLARGQVAPRRTWTDVAELVQRIIDQSERTEHRIDAQLEPVVASLDAKMIERVVDNLIRNAQRHTPEGTNVWVRLSSTASGLRLVVEDDGPGVAPELREMLFEPFAQAGTATSSHSPGTGIGLSLVERFVEVHGGQVVLDERPGGGARFTIELPHVE